MKISRLALPLVATSLFVTINTRAADQPPQSPKVHLTLPEPCRQAGLNFSYRLKDSPYTEDPHRQADKAYADATICTGEWTEPQFKVRYPHGASGFKWQITVRHQNSRAKARRILRSMRSVEQAKSGKLTEQIHSQAYLFSRFEKKRFRWGKAVSYLVQLTESGIYYEPNSEDLLYEVHGVTDDYRFSIDAAFSLGHTGLPAERSSAKNQKDRPEELEHLDTYRLITEAKPETFEPSLFSIDDMLDTLQIEGIRAR
jgi:hypothetical protein